MTCSNSSLPVATGTEESQFESFADYIEPYRQGDDLPFTVADENSAIALNYTSGTTGRPKGVIYTHRGAYLNAMGAISTQGFDGDTVYLWTLPMFHCSGWCTGWAVMAVSERRSRCLLFADQKCGD